MSIRYPRFLWNSSSYADKKFPTQEILKILHPKKTKFIPSKIQIKIYWKFEFNYKTKKKTSNLKLWLKKWQPRKFSRFCSNIWNVDRILKIVFVANETNHAFACNAIITDVVFAPFTFLDDIGLPLITNWTIEAENFHFQQECMQFRKILQ